MGFVHEDEEQLVFALLNLDRITTVTSVHIYIVIVIFICSVMGNS